MTIDQERPEDELDGAAAVDALTQQRTRFVDGAITSRKYTEKPRTEGPGGWWVGLSREEMSAAVRRLFPEN